MINFISFLCLFFCLQSVTAQNPVPYLKKDGKYIYVDSATMQPSVLISGEFDVAVTFDKGVAIAIKKPKNYFINDKGVILEICLNYPCTPFNDGFGLALKDGNKYCIINKSGKEITPFKYTDFISYAEGIFILKNSSGDFVYVDTASNEIASIVGDNGYPFKAVSSFKNGFAKVLSSRIGAKETFIDKKGKKLPELDYHLMTHDFSEGRAAVYDYDTKNSSWGYVDETGKVVIAQKYSKPGMFNQGYAVVSSFGSKNNKGIVIDKTGKEICDFSYYIESGYYYGIVGVSFTEKEKFVKGFVNMKGKLVGKKTFDHFVLPGNGLVAAGNKKANNTQIYELQIYNISLEPLSDKLYEEVGTAGSNGMIRVKSGNKFGYINEKGEEIIPLKYDGAENFINGYAVVNFSGGKRFYISATGREYREQ